MKDDPSAAAKSFSEGAAAARELLIEALIGQAKALQQINNREDAIRCLIEALSLMQHQSSSKRGKSNRGNPDVLLGSVADGVVSMQLKGRVADRFEELLTEVVTSSSA